jgi:ADP-ribose pyrophosphatase
VLHYVVRCALKHSIISRKYVFHGHAFNVQDLYVSLPDGRKRNYDLVDHQDSVTIIPVDETGKIWFVEQFRMLVQIGSIYLAPGYSNELNHIFLAKDLKPDPLQQDEDEFLSIKKYSKEELIELIHGGDLRDSKSLAALYLYEHKLL